MMKFFKYLLLARVFKKSKKNIIILTISFILLIFSVLIINDLINVSTKAVAYMLLLSKWIIVFILSISIFFNLSKILNTFYSPLSIKNDKEKTSTDAINQNYKKEKILAKEKLLTQSDLIIQKYKKEQEV